MKRVFCFQKTILEKMIAYAAFPFSCSEYDEILPNFAQLLMKFKLYIVEWSVKKVKPLKPTNFDNILSWYIGSNIINIEYILGIFLCFAQRGV